MVSAATPDGESPQHRPVQSVAISPGLDEEVLRNWKSTVETAPRGLAKMHPRVVCDSASKAESRQSNILLYRPDGAGQFDSMALLTPRRVHLPILPGTSWQVSLSGLSLVGSRILGADDAIPGYAAAVARLLNQDTHGYECVLMEDLLVDSPWWSAFNRSSEVITQTIAALQPHWYLKFPETADAYWGRFSAKTRQYFRRLRRMLAHSCEVVREQSAVAGFLAAASEVSANSWQGKRFGQRVGIDDAQVRQFNALAEIGALRCYLLRSDKQPVAFITGAQWNGCYRLEEIGYDISFAKSSPGTLLFLDMLDDLYAHDTPAVMDLGFGDAAYKQLFGNESSQAGILLAARRSLGPMMTLGMHRLSASLERAARTGFRVTGLERWARRIYRR